ncbi:MAG: hypothetical protein K6A05_09365 [Lachnospiraceae bacterium]|nr:hypothetical protein [Lachnospiraceae bacterium]
MDKKHLNDVRLNADNKYEYMGDYYKWSSVDASEKRLVLSVAVGVVFEVICGILPNTGADGHPWIMIPFMFAMIMAFILAWRMGQLFLYKKKCKEYQKKHIENWFPASSFFLGFNGAFTAIASIVSGGVVSFYPWLQFMASAGGFAAYLLYKRIVWEKIPKSDVENN